MTFTGSQVSVDSHYLYLLDYCNF